MAETNNVRKIVDRDTIWDSAPLGLAAYAFTIFILSARNTGWEPDLVWVGPAMFSGGLVLLMAGMWEFSRNDVFGATAFSSLGGFWMSFGFFILLALSGLIPLSINLTDAFGWLTGGLLVFNTYMTITAALVPKAVFTTFACTEITLLLQMIGYFLLSPGWIFAGGCMGIITSCAAWYASFAILFNITAKKEVFPLGVPLLTFTSSNNLTPLTKPLDEDPLSSLIVPI